MSKTKPFEEMTIEEQADSLINDMIRRDSKYKIMNIWELEGTFKNKLDQDYLDKIFGNVRQKLFVRGLISLIVEALAFHETFEESHDKTILKDLSKLQAQFRNHRHDFSKSYSGKTEY